MRATLQLDQNLGRLEVSTVDGDAGGDGDFDQLFSFGSGPFPFLMRRAISSLTVAMTSSKLWLLPSPANFGSDNDENSFDTRSDDAGPEPEGITLGEVDGRTYAFIGLERVGGIVVYDITDPTNSTFVQYINNRDFTQDVELPDGSANPAAGDLGRKGCCLSPLKIAPTVRLCWWWPMKSVGLPPFMKFNRMTWFLPQRDR